MTPFAELDAAPKDTLIASQVGFGFGKYII